MQYFSELTMKTMESVAPNIFHVCFLVWISELVNFDICGFLKAENLSNLFNWLVFYFYVSVSAAASLSLSATVYLV